MTLAGALVAWATLAATAVEVQSAVDCPSGAAVVERLLPLLPERGASTDPPDRARIDLVDAANVAAGLRLRLERGDGQVIGERTVAARPTCSEAAEAIAAILAAWESAPVPPATEEPLAAAVVVPLPAIVAPPTAPARRFELVAGGSVGAAFVGGSAAVGTVEVLGGLANRSWQLRFAATTATARQRELGGGHVDWRPTTFGAAVVVRTLHPRWRLSVDAGPLLGWATLTGVGFSPGRSDSSLQYGGGAGLRVTRRLGRFGLWAEARATAWINVVEAQATGTTRTETAELPQVDANVNLGVAARLF